MARSRVRLVTATALAATAAAVTLGLPAAAPAETAARVVGPAWQPARVDTDETFRGLDAVDRRTAWVSGDEGSVFRTTDRGRRWDDVSPTGSDGLLFRDVEARDASHASVLAVGEHTNSRIYTTTDGGDSWQRTFTNRDQDAFYDCMAFWRGGRHGLAMSDPVGGKFRIIATDDGGQTWRRLPRAGMPPAVDGEFGFAASGTCLVTAGTRQAWMGSGGEAARIFHTRDRGLTWQVRRAPIPATPAGGVFSLAFEGVDHGVAVGGDFERPGNGRDASGFTRNGHSWTGGGDLSGYRSGVAWVPRTVRSVLVAVGPTGSDVTYDGGRSWARFSGLALDAVSCAPDGGCWGSGHEGMVARLHR